MGILRDVLTQNLSHKTGVQARIFVARQSIGKHFQDGSTLIPRQPNIQFTTIIVMCTHTCLSENKYPNVGRYRHTQGHTNLKPLSQTGHMSPYFRCLTIYSKTFSSISTLIPRQPNIQFTTIIVIYTHTCLPTNNYPDAGR